MGNHRFRLSNMMPNAWFYKLKDMKKPTSRKRNVSQPPVHQNQKQKQPPRFVPSRASYYFPSNSPLHPKALDTHFPLDPPRISHRKTRKIPTNAIITTTTPRLISSHESNDIVFDVISELKLPPIPTKSSKKEENMTKAWLHSPRLVNKKVRVVQRRKQRKGVGESFAVVKISSDPEEDFRESMLEMIIENNLRAAKDLEELLGCYLYLNSNEYHDMIVKLFAEIWFDIL